MALVGGGYLGVPHDDSHAKYAGVWLSTLDAYRMTEAANDIQLAAFFSGKSRGRLVIHLGIRIRIDSWSGGRAHLFSVPTLATPAIAICIDQAGTASTAPQVFGHGYLSKSSGLSVGRQQPSSAKVTLQHLACRRRLAELSKK